MPKLEQGTAAYLNIQMRKHQKSKIRWYCGLCHVASKDENGYKCHLEHETHIHREQAVQESLRTFKLSKEDSRFRRKFLAHLVSKHFGQTVLAHDIYRDIYPLDRGHNIIKATCWETLGVFIAQLKKEGRIEAHKGVKGWQIRVSADDFSGDSSEDHDTPESNGVKQKSESSSQLELVSHKRVKIEDLESHTKSTSRTSDSKVVFALGKPIKNESKKPTIAPAFGALSSD
jgi:hypothetical protein